ncbi:MAG: hypothetical protein A2664_03490 [Candidatus Taylorbacteria bacterium RIFCSPHIGHO2_01_FULL_46_22b]|uniref:Baseplate protein J-like domain-containing protein n=1 Tax=Candidatus Taylorbacteria bacterium RIFCSPHIGHO2_01_FULL_46_22b TaxID=1802301 RepID=A0A1G2M198_9BACT|nr:MAG: hypothetical protein A2664_03490 [Candidatus Taylorbacteria bacterium RIFCSPHIGHO2_01_FULL_46_22b]
MMVLIQSRVGMLYFEKLKMIKKILQDIMPPGRKSIRHIPLPRSRKVEIEEERPSEKRAPRKKNGRFFRWGIIVGSILVLAAAGILVSNIFSSAVVTITPKQITASVDISLPISSMPSNAVLAYTVLTATSSASEVVPSNKEADVQKKASGQIVVYNNFSNADQRLIKNTRFEAPDGRIYRIDSSVVVPGQKIESGSKVPGSITVTVYADAVGTDYNLKVADLKGDFTIPGFKGSPRYEAFYGRIKSDIVGGFSGKARVVDEVTLSAITDKLKVDLAESLKNKINSSLPTSVVAPQDLSSVDFSINSVDNPSGDGVVISVLGVVHALAFDTFAFSEAVANKMLSEYTGGGILIQNLSDLDLVPHNSTQKALWEAGNLSLSVSGNAHFVWQFDEKKVKEDLEGKPKQATNGVMQKYSAIEQAEVILKPMWLQSYPSNPDKIHIKLKLD